MSLKLAKNNAPTYDYISEGDGTDPISVAGTVTGAGGTVIRAGRNHRRICVPGQESGRGNVSTIT